MYVACASGSLSKTQGKAQVDYSPDFDFVYGCDIDGESMVLDGLVVQPVDRLTERWLVMREQPIDAGQTDKLTWIHREVQV